MIVGTGDGDAGLRVVITGASSGIGKATALLLAEEGAALVLAARREHALVDAARGCEARGAGAALVHPVDVTDEEAVLELAARAERDLGAIDAWVNLASVISFGSFEETPPEVFRRVVETNFFGNVHVARAAMPHFRSRGRGTLVLVSSIIGKAAAPLMSPYAASKHAVTGFAESLRTELHGTGVHVCTVYPPSTDTPIYRQGANYTGREARPPPPVYRPETTARAIVDCLHHPRREVSVGASNHAIQATHALAHGLYERAAVPYVERGLLTGMPVPRTDGNVLAPDPRTTGVTGGWKDGTAPARRYGDS